MNLPDDPLLAFADWKARLSPGDDAACLATADGDGVPSARIVLVKMPFEFHTNRHSAKGRDLAANPRAALVFHWRPDHQVRVVGRVEELSEAECDAYWSTRPRGSQLGALASHQSAVIEERAHLEASLAEVTARFADVESIPRPPHWGGYRVVPDAVEFWQHRDDRLHDRLRFRAAEGAWVAERLSP